MNLKNLPRSTYISIAVGAIFFLIVFVGGSLISKKSNMIDKQGVAVTAQVTSIHANAGSGPASSDSTYSYTVSYQFTPEGSSTQVTSTDVIHTDPGTQPVIDQAINKHTVQIKYLPSKPTENQIINHG